MMKTSRRIFCAGLCLVPLMSAAWAGTPASNQATDKLNAFLKSTSMAVGEFTQAVVDRTGREAAPKSTGYFRFMRPGKFEWTYVTPYRQEIMSDGEILWIHDPELYQVTVKKLSGALPSTPAAILFGDRQFDDDWTVVNRSALELEATPKKAEGSFELVRITFTEKGELQQMELLDTFGQTTTLVIKGLERKTLQADTFKLQIPEGTDVIEAAL